MNNIDTQLTVLNNGLKSFLNNESDKETIDKIANLDEIVNNISAEYNKVLGDYNDLKNDYINLVKHSGYSANKGSIADDIGIQKEPPSFEAVVQEILSQRK